MVADAQVAGALVQALAADDATGARTLLQAVEPSDPGTLDVLAESSASGSRLALELLLARLDASGIVRGFVGASLLDQAAVDDVSQDTLISVATSIGSFSGRSKVTTWVHQIARNRVVDHLRRQRATAPLPEDDIGPGARMSSWIATRETVQRAVASLPDLYREPVVLRDLTGLTYDEIADRLDRSLGTVKSQIARGRAMVAAALGDTAPS